MLNVVLVFPYGVISETEEITIYNTKLNRYENGRNIYFTVFNYQSKNKSKEKSIYIDIPYIESKKSIGYKIKQINRIDKNSLYNYKNTSY